MTPGLLARATGGRRKNHTLGWGRGERGRGKKPELRFGPTESEMSVRRGMRVRGMLRGAPELDNAQEC